VGDMMTCQLQSSDNLFYRLVLETLTPLPPSRKCFRMVNGVLVERTVEDVVPTLQTNADGLKKILDDLVKQYKKTQDEMEKWKVCRIPDTQMQYDEHACGKS
jgi:chaperonin cofactor prefoldin